MIEVRFVIVVIFILVSDSCTEKKNDDRSGPLLERLVTDKESEIGRQLNAEIECSAIIPDDELFIMVNNT